MEVFEFRAATFDELAAKLNELSQDNWYATTDLHGKQIFAYKPIKEKEEQSAVPDSLDQEMAAKRFVKATEATTAAKAVLENAVKISELAAKEQTRLLGELGKGKAELQRAVDAASIDAATAQVTLAETLLERNKLEGIRAAEAQQKAAEKAEAARTIDVPSISEPSRPLEFLSFTPHRIEDR